MIDLKETIDINKIKATKFIVGDEYLLVYQKCIGIYLGKSRSQIFFAITYSIKDSNITYSTGLTVNLWYHREIEGVRMNSNFIPLYEKIKSKFSNLKDLFIT